jgi:cation diffusion facilitator family transporter
LRVAAQPADQDHPYGHGRAEAVAALIVALMLCGAGIGIGVEAVKDMIGAAHRPAPFTLGVLLLVIAVKEVMYQLARKAARQSGSTAMLADAWHHRSDAITSFAAAIGIAVAVFGGQRYAMADDWAALVAAAVILCNAYRIVQSPVQELMDKEPPDIVAQVRAIARRVPDVADVEKVFARKSGIGYWVDMHLEVAPEMSVRKAHELAHGVKDAIRLAMPQVEDVLIHIEPHSPDKIASANADTGHQSNP